MDLRDQLQSSLGSAYTLERELGGGGMSRVFLAVETRLQRQVAIKVLPPDLAQGISVERFEREIQTAAALQQANIVPVLSAGDTHGVPYYVMPFVEGESLRARLARGPLAINEVLGVLRDVARALSYAHEHGVVHRDIKPDNVLLSHGAAMVTDFGIAKAISASRTGAGGATLTQLGTSIGTPAYMAPEQAAGDPTIDHRADLYSFGCLAYELLTGQAPFAGRTPQRMLAAHMGETPKSVADMRPDAPASLAHLVMTCLAKDSNDRPPSAADVLKALEAITSDSGMQGVSSALPGGQAMFWKALLLYAGAFVVVAVLAKLAIVRIGLPDWVFPGSLIVMALGLPVVLLAGIVHHQARIAATQASRTPRGTATQHGTMTKIALKARPWLSWRRTALGGATAIGTFTLLVGAWMVLRAFGIGPAGSLFAAGTLNEHDAILVTEFASPASDSSLGPVVTEALRTGLAESRSISVLSPAAIRDHLQRMGQPRTARVDVTLGHQIAAREGLKAVVDGDVLAIGNGFVLLARLVNTRTGEPIATFKENAKNADDIIPAIDRITKKLRARVGESLRTIQAGTPLDRVTTSSFEALRLYVQGKKALEEEGDLTKGEPLLMQAIHLDTAFAMASRKLALELANRFIERARVNALLQLAFDHVDRLGDVERHLTEGAYYTRGPHADEAKAIRAYQAVLDIDPAHAAALNNLGVISIERREYERAVEYGMRAHAADTTMYNPYLIVTAALYALGERAKARAELDSLVRRFPRNQLTQLVSMQSNFVEGRLDAVKSRADSLLRAASDDPAARLMPAQSLAYVASARGELAEAGRLRHLSRAAEMERGVIAAPLADGLDSALTSAWFRDDQAGALRTLNGALLKHPIGAILEGDRPYREVVRILTLAGSAARAKETQAAFERANGQEHSHDIEEARHAIRGDIAILEHRWDDAAQEYRKAGTGVLCNVCMLPDLARAFDLGGHADSAVAVFERYIATADVFRGSTDGLFLAGAHKRLGELYEAKGDWTKASEHYTAFLDLWKNADRELQPKVREVRTRLAALRAREKR